MIVAEGMIAGPRRLGSAFRQREGQVPDQPFTCHFSPSPSGSRILAPDSFPSPFLIGQKLPTHGDFDPVSFGILDFLYFHGEIDGAHNPVSKFLVNQFLERISVDQIDFMKSVQERVLGDVLRSQTFLRGRLQEGNDIGA